MVWNRTIGFFSFDGAYMILAPIFNFGEAPRNLAEFAHLSAFLGKYITYKSKCITVNTSVIPSSVVDPDPVGSEIICRIRNY